MPNPVVIAWNTAASAAHVAPAAFHRDCFRHARVNGDSTFRGVLSDTRKTPGLLKTIGVFTPIADTNQRTAVNAEAATVAQGIQLFS